MFLRSRSSSSEPAKPRFRADLAALGFELNDDKFVQAGSDGRLFSFFHTNNEHVNLLRKEAMHECARAAVFDRAKGFGLAKTYLVGNTISVDKPNGPHVPILTTEVSELVKRKHVLVVVGERTQDLGIWAWRTVMGSGGIMDGSAAGLAAAVQALGQAQRSDPEEDLDHSADPFIKYPWHAEGDPTMGIIILNPGQLLYSAQLNRCMTQSSWLARNRATAMADEFAIDEEYNSVPGHTSPEEHIRTFFDSILKQMVHPKVHLYIVGIADGADHVVDYLNTEYARKTRPPVYYLVDSLALIQPTFNPEDLLSDTLRIFLGTRWARGWAMSDKPKGTLLNTPAPYPPRNVHERDDHINEDESYNYAADYTVCSIFSGGVADYLETLWPTVMGDVLEYLFNSQQEAIELESRLCKSPVRPSFYGTDEPQGPSDKPTNVNEPTHGTDSPLTKEGPAHGLARNDSAESVLSYVSWDSDYSSLTDLLYGLD